MAGSVKTVCFITSLVISWGLFEVGEAIVAWLDYKINGTEIPWKCELTNPIRICHMISILVHGLFLHGIRKENTNFIEPWITFYCLFMIATFIPTGILVSIYGSNFLAFTEYIFLVGVIHSFINWAKHMIRGFTKRMNALNCSVSEVAQNFSGSPKYNDKHWAIGNQILTFNLPSQ